MDLKYIKTIIREGVLECKSLYLVILLIGATVSVWISSGVVPTMIYYGLTYLQNVNFLFAGFLMIAISAVFMGTAIGTVSTIGIAILGIGRGFNIPDYILVGMIVSGAFMADKISPISGLLNLTLTTTNTSYKETVKCSLKTMIPTILICALIYYMIGRNYINLDKDNISFLLIKDIKQEFFISPYMLLLPIMIIILSIVGVKSIYCMVIGIIGGSILSICFQNVSTLDLLNYMIFGYNINSASEIINSTLISGGVISMVSVVLIVIGAISLGSMLQGMEIISYLTKDIFISPYMLLLPIMIIILSIVGVKSIYCMVIGIIGGSILSICFQNVSTLDLLNYMIFGYNINSASEIINSTLISGGVISMVSVVLIVIGAISLGSMLQGMEIISYLTKDIIKTIKNKKDLILKTSFISSILTIVTCDQTIGIVIPSKLLKEKYDEIKVSRGMLARTISDTGVIIAPIMPWNVNALIITSVTGVSCLRYAPFSMLCFIFPIVTILSAYINIRKEEKSYYKQ